VRVPAGWKQAWTAAMRDSGDSRFSIWPESSRDELYPIIYLEPMDRRNRAALGYDMLTEPARRQAMELAAETGQATATGRVTLEQEIDAQKQAGFLIYVPIYRGELPLATVDDRRAALEGFVYLPFRADDLLRGLLGGGNPNLAIEVYAGEVAPENLLHRSHSAEVIGADPRFSEIQRLEVAGSPWTVAYSTLPAFEASSARDQVWLLLLLGLVASGTLFAVTRAQVAARSQAESANQAKDHFMATLSHELRTPLTPVLAVLSRLETFEESLPTAARDGLTMIRRNVELEARLIDDLLDLTRIAQGKLELRRGPADLRQVLELAIEASAKPGIPGPRVLTELSRGDLRVWADAPRLAQVFWNVINNARKFTPPEGTVRVRAWRRETEIAVEVADTGIGIDPAHLPQIFDAFQQGQRTITRKFGGLGLGLAISERIVKLHGGRITAASEGRGRGARFTIYLPAGRPPATLEAAVPEIQEAAPPPAAKRARPLHVLLIEDHQDTAEAMAELLRATGRQVTVAASVAEGLSAAEASLGDRREDRVNHRDNNGAIDIVLSDIGLPDGSGHDLMAELSRRFGLPGIALTGYGMDEDVERSRNAGFVCHLTKPVSLEQLEAAIVQAVGQ
jgi:signal transduction histidine kinase/ActR/RegA family two-component response regulator